jgi:hypothetical protein
VFVAGHDFASLRPGEYCRGDNCKGVSSLVDLCSLADVVKVDDEFVAHSGVLNQREVDEIKNARVEMRKAVEAAWGA